MYSCASPYSYLGYYGNPYGNGCSCSACGNANGGAYTGYPFGGDPSGCCGGGTPAGPGLYDSRCFVQLPISQDCPQPASLPLDEPLYTPAYQAADAPVVVEPLSAGYGSAYNLGVIESAMCGQLLSSFVHLDGKGTSLGVTLDSGALKVTDAGVYEIRLFGNFSYTEPTYLEWSVSVNDAVLDDTAATMTVSANEMKSFERTALVRLEAGDTLKIHVASETAGDIYIRPHGVSLTVKKIAE